MAVFGETDAPASATEPETADAKGVIALLKGIKNQNITIMADLAAIRAILES